MNEMDLPEIRNVIDPKNYHVDGTPDGQYALRILRFYRQLCDTKWVVEGISDGSEHLYTLMNTHQDQRAIELDEAIRILERRE
jgi:hypothetical protein